jgi:hypothetical protein
MMVTSIATAVILVTCIVTQLAPQLVISFPRGVPLAFANLIFGVKTASILAFANQQAHNHVMMALMVMVLVFVSRALLGSAVRHVQPTCFLQGSALASVMIMKLAIKRGNVAVMAIVSVMLVDL